MTVNPYEIRPFGEGVNTAADFEAFVQSLSTAIEANPTYQNESSHWRRNLLITIVVALLALAGTSAAYFLSESELSAIDYQRYEAGTRITQIPQYLHDRSGFVSLTSEDIAHAEPTATNTDTDTTTTRTVAQQVFPAAQPTSATATPIATATGTPTAPAQNTEVSRVTAEVDTPIEMILGGEFYRQEVVHQREQRLGLVAYDSLPDGMIWAELDGERFPVPAEVPADMHFLFSPATAANSLGIGSVPTEQRLDFLRQHIDSGRINIFVAGLDYRPEFGAFRGRTDAPMIVSIDVQTGHTTLISVGRDTWDPVVAQYTGNSRANSEISVMSWGRMGQRGFEYFHPAFSRHVMENLCGCLIDGVWQLNFEAVSEIIDSTFPQGVTIHVPHDIYDDTFTYPPLDLRAGSQQLDGNTLVTYGRSRHTSGNGDLSRQDRQRQIMMALVGELASTGKQFLSDMDIAGGLDYFHSTLTATRDSFAAFDARRAELEAGERSIGNEGYLRTFGLSPVTLTDHLVSARDELTQPQRLLEIGRFLLGADGQAWLGSFQSGDIFQTIQITSADTQGGGGNAPQYYRGARERILDALNLPNDPLATHR